MKTLIYLFAGVTISLSSCSSPLSDTPVSDPGLVTPHIVINHKDGDYGIANKVSTCLMDKNGAYIELLEGDVKVNGDLMEFGMTCYKRTIDVQENTVYKVVLTLADSAKYPFKVTTPHFFKKVDYPGKVKKGKAFEVSWKSEGNEQTTVNFSVQDTSDNWITLYEEITDQSMVTISPDNYPKGDISKGSITLYRSVNGKMPNGFNGGSVKANCIFERSIKIK
ncbi:hypothetical protein [Parvicella tangerina]|uniref:Uncharacterized protein n=1 Tax=Parvicella tangerina TaxID=2829795 RepID=A0A916JM02_9FLAO|nr:hypothetical protein [Parvicella tangerina]CAG5080919.1 hypothetical protein CRYO30217_01481 [Parvicella tangerina]